MCISAQLLIHIIWSLCYLLLFTLVLIYLGPIIHYRFCLFHRSFHLCELPFALSISSFSCYMYRSHSENVDSLDEKSASVKSEINVFVRSAITVF